jgi:hypothetical protein
MICSDAAAVDSRVSAGWSVRVAMAPGDVAEMDAGVIALGGEGVVVFARSEVDADWGSRDSHEKTS